MEAGRATPLLDGDIAVEPFMAADAVEVARLRPLTRVAGLSLGDRACLALAHRLQRALLTQPLMAVPRVLRRTLVCP